MCFIMEKQENVLEQPRPVISFDKPSKKSSFSPIQSIRQSLVEVHLINGQPVSVRAPNVIETDLLPAAADAHTSSASLPD